AGGYPENSRTGDVITGLDAAARVPGVSVFHAGTAMRDGKIVTSSGRVLGVTARGATLPEALARAYQAAELIQFEGRQYRRDIAARALGSG
ncbi:MAG TPA: phosphoribosylglycinamide synthetase C domain-containing protein, partial [Polyangiaceae bacterium]